MTGDEDIIANDHEVFIKKRYHQQHHSLKFIRVKDQEKSQRNKFPRFAVSLTWDDKFLWSMA